MEKIGVFLPSLINNLGIRDAVNLKFLRKKWKDIFSAPLNEYCYPKEIKEGVLHVTVSSHAWLNELKLLKEAFLKSLSPYGIRDVEFKYGKIYPQKHKSIEDKQDNKLSPQQQEWIASIVERVKDEELNLLLKNLIERYLKHVNKKLEEKKYERF